MIPVYVPSLGGNEAKYVMDAVQSGWISSLGEYVDRFEGAIRDVTGAKHTQSRSLTDRSQSTSRCIALISVQATK